MKMAVSKYRLFIMFLTTYYIFDSVFAARKTNKKFYKGVNKLYLSNY